MGELTPCRCCLLPGSRGSWRTSLLAALAAGFFLGSPATARDFVGDPSFTVTGEGGTFIRGDANLDRFLDISDAIVNLGYLYNGDVNPYCLDALDTDDNGVLDITDAVDVLNSLFLGSFKIPAPSPAPGLDPTDDNLLCDNGRFAALRRQIFTVTCATSSCHSQSSASGGLDLEGTAQYSQLYQTNPTNPAALAAGLKRVRPGSANRSYLFKVLSGNLGPGEGDPALHSELLTHSQLELVRHWIDDGAPPSTYKDVVLPPPASGEQIVIPPFPVAVGKEVQRNYYFKLKSDTDFWVNRVEFLSPPGGHTLNLFTGDPRPFPDGFFEDNFTVVPFRDWTLCAASQGGRLDWKLPAGSALKFQAHEQVLAQIHFVNTGSQISPIGGCAVFNLHKAPDDPPPMPMGALFIQNKNILIPAHTELAYPSGITFDYGITLDLYGHNVPVKVAAITGHFHSRGKTFEIRRWDGAKRNPDGTPALGEFDRMGEENTIYFSDSWIDPPFNLFDESEAPELPAGWGLVYRCSYVNTSDNKYCFGAFAETKEHANAFIFFYPGPSSGSFVWFPPDCIGQGCTVPCQ